MDSDEARDRNLADLLAVLVAGLLGAGLFVGAVLQANSFGEEHGLMAVGFPWFVWIQESLADVCRGSGLWLCGPAKTANFVFALLQWPAYALGARVAARSRRMLAVGAVVIVVHCIVARWALAAIAPY